MRNVQNVPSQTRAGWWWEQRRSPLLYYSKSDSLALELTETAPCSCQAQTEHSYIERLHITQARGYAHFYINSCAAKNGPILFDRRERFEHETENSKHTAKLEKSKPSFVLRGIKDNYIINLKSLLLCAASQRQSWWVGVWGGGGGGGAERKWVNLTVTQNRL